MERTWKPTTAGVMTIITGVMGIIGSVVLFLLSGFIGGLGGMDLGSMFENWSGGWWGPGVANMPDIMGDIVGIGTTLFLVLGIVVLVFGIIALVGGVSSIKRRRWGLCLTGSIMSLFIMPILGILAIIFVSMGKGEFE